MRKRTPRIKQVVPEAPSTTPAGGVVILPPPSLVNIDGVTGFPDNKGYWQRLKDKFRRQTT